jgi:hypothetical protein
MQQQTFVVQLAFTTLTQAQVEQLANMLCRTANTQTSDYSMCVLHDGEQVY